jgi:hypothetical protein
MSKGSDDRFTDTVQSTRISDESGPDMGTSPVGAFVIDYARLEFAIVALAQASRQLGWPKTRASGERKSIWIVGLGRRL